MADSADQSLDTIHRASSSSSSSSTVPPAPLSSPLPQPSRIRRRNRMITSCLECRRRKLKCTRSHPCTNCLKFARDCVFLAPALDQASQLKLAELKEKVGSLERLLERDVANTSAAAPVTSSSLDDRALPEDKDDNIPAAEDEEGLVPTPLSVLDAAYGDEGDRDGDHNDDLLLDLGIQMGKMRVTDRIGGFFRPKISNELEIITLSDTSRTGNRIVDEGVEAPSYQCRGPRTQDFLKPGPSYIAPEPGFFFGQGTQQTSLIDFLPSRLAADRLIKQYFIAVHPIAQILHRPTFEKEYKAFWDEVSLGIEPPNSVQTIVFAAMFSGVISLDEAVIFRDFGVSKASIIDNFRLGTETALARANFLRTTKIETLQAFVMYLIPLCRAEVSRAHSVLLGAAIRMAECMGLHRDGENYGLNPLETHVRRLIWHQLCFLDIRTCEAQGPRPTIRRDDFDTKPPLNIDDVDLHSSGEPPVAANRWTDATFSLIRFEVHEMMRTIWIDRPRIERRKISLTAVLGKIETFRRNMAARYDHLMDDKIPVQKCAKIVKALLLSRLHIMVLHRYHFPLTGTMPERLLQMMVSSGTQTLETAITLETLPELHNWAWYGGALQQYHTAFLLLAELFVKPDRKEADRIWNCLDYVFETVPSDPREIKARKVLSELQHKTAVYQSMRRLRAPIAMEKYLGQRLSRVSEKKRPLHSSDTGQDSLLVVDKVFFGKVPIQNTNFTGLSNNGESLWAPPNQLSPEASSDSGTAMEHGLSLEFSLAGSDDLMADIDWDAFDALFPAEEHNDVTSLPDFTFQSPVTLY